MYLRAPKHHNKSYLHFQGNILFYVLIKSNKEAALSCTIIISSFKKNFLQLKECATPKNTYASI